METNIDAFIKNPSALNGKDFAGNTIKEIYRQTDKYILYKIYASKKIDEFMFAQSSSCKNEEDLYPLYYKVKEILSEICIYPSYTTYKLKAINIISEAIKNSTQPNKEDKGVEKLYNSVKQELWRQQISTKYYMLSGLFFVLFTIIIYTYCYFVIFENKDVNSKLNHYNFIYPIMSCTVAASAGYFSMLLRINTYYYEGDNLNQREYQTEENKIIDNTKVLSIVKALSRILISCIAGYIAYIILESNIINILNIPSEEDSSTALFNKHGFVVIFISFIAGFSEKLIPDIMLTYQKSAKKQTGVTSGTENNQV
ncbi:MAG: hypothetical protein ACRDCN_07815 [Tannerellaceae bacterium]